MKKNKILEFLSEWLPFGAASLLAWLAYLYSIGIEIDTLGVSSVALISFLLSTGGSVWFWVRSKNAFSLDEMGRLQNLLGDRLTRPDETPKNLVERLEAAFRKKKEKLERERRENRVLLESIADGVVAFNSKREAVFFNTQFEALFPFEVLEGERPRLEEVFSVDPGFLRKFDSVLKSGGTERLTFKREIEGVEHYYDLSISPLRREESDAYGALGVFHDITELKRAEQIRIDFVSNVSHELRTPLTAIKGYADTLESDFSTADTETLAGYVSTISRNSNRLMALVTDLLDLSSLESGAELARSQVELRPFTERVVSQFRARARDKEIEIEILVQEPFGFIDESRMEQVLVNLVENALKYIPEKRKISILWSRTESGFLTLEVSDNGNGISREHLPRLFERFYRVDKARSRQLGGTGLGLAIVKHIIQRHGGSVRAESSPGKGTRFICVLPQNETTIQVSSLERSF